MTAWDHILHKDEHILWQGKPGKTVSFEGFHLMECFVGVFFMAFSVVWIAQTMNITSDSGLDGPVSIVFRLFPFFGLIFFAIGFNNAIGKYLWRAFMNGRTFYTLTNKRVFVAEDVPLKQRSLKDYYIDPETSLEWQNGNLTITVKQVGMGSGAMVQDLTLKSIGADMQSVQIAFKDLQSQ